MTSQRSSTPSTDELSGLADGLATSVGGAYTGPATPTPSHDLSTQAVSRAELLG